MINLQKIVVLAFVFNFSVCSFSEELTSDWVGNWKGGCFSNSGRSDLPSKYSMDLKISNKNFNGNFDFSIVYKYVESKATETRNYSLILRDEKTGYYVMDEKNSILIDTYFSSPTLTSLFAINGKLFFILYKLKDKKIEVTMPRWDATGNTRSGGKSIPSVVSFGQLDIDQCELHKN